LGLGAYPVASPHQPTPLEHRVDELPPDIPPGQAVYAEGTLATGQGAAVRGESPAPESNVLIAELAKRGATVTETGPRHGMAGTQLILGASHQVTFAKPVSVSYCCWPQVAFEETSDSVTPFKVGYAVRGLTSVLVLIDTSGRVVSVEPTGYDSLVVTKEPYGRAVDAARSARNGVR
jgi:hypothetical protein